ncbi:erythromycin esterase family protein [Fimbriimonas ginsengisoli]|nr:erythromycin esterase family protein [Fimbriimonas ginsengisoli]
MLHDEDPRLLAELKSRSRELAFEDPLDDLIDRIGDARFVLIGEASHGTSEYYSWRARLSQRLIVEKGFSFVGVEGDWPDCYAVNRFVKGYADGGDHARDVLKRFNRWPTWMWANWEVVAFATWLRAHNERLPVGHRVGFYGLDVYSLWESLDAVLIHLRQYHQQAVPAAMKAMACLHPFERDPQNYAMSLRYVSEDCEDEVVRVLRELQLARPDFPDDVESHFNAEQNALAAVGAERYYRTMIQNDDSSWNVRDTHMTDTLDRLLVHYGPTSKAIVWEHNTHVGDARATDMAEAGMVNVGQLVRSRQGRDDCFIVGFSGYGGEVIAGDYWGAPMEAMSVPAARDGSWEHLLHSADPMDRLVLTSDLRDVPEFRRRRGHRAIGVVYHPDRERWGNYVPTDLINRYDALIAFEQTSALHPLHLNERSLVEPPETYPYAL